MDDPDTTLRFRLILLGWGGLVAALAWLARTLSAGGPFGVARIVGGLLGAWIAAFSYGALAYEYLEVSPLFILGSAGPVGWIGGDLLAALAQFFTQKLGVRAPTEDGERDA